MLLQAPVKMAPEIRIRYEELQRSRAKHEMFRILALELGYDQVISELNDICGKRIAAIDAEVASLIVPSQEKAVVDATIKLTIATAATLLGVSERTLMRIEASPQRMKEICYPGRDVGYKVFASWATPLRTARALNKAARARSH